MSNGTPVYLHVCDDETQECLRVRYPLTLHGSVVDISIYDIDHLIDAIYQAADELDEVIDDE